MLSLWSAAVVPIHHRFAFSGEICNFLRFPEVQVHRILQVFVPRPRMFAKMDPLDPADHKGRQTRTVPRNVKDTALLSRS